MWAEDRLVGASNWSRWKTMIIFVLEDLELWDIVQAPMVLPPVTTPLLVAEFRKRNTKAKKTICDAKRDHVLPHLTEKDYAFELWDSCASSTKVLIRTERWFCRRSSGAFRCSS
jgi:hypothetical protein